MIAASGMSLKDYQESIRDKVQECYNLARRIRGMGKDVTDDVEIPLASDMADRIEELIKIKGVADDIRTAAKESFFMVSIRSGFLVLQKSMSGCIPISRSCLTLCWVGFVFCSSTEPIAGIRVKLKWVDSDEVVGNPSIFDDVNGILIPGGDVLLVLFPDVL